MDVDVNALLAAFASAFNQDNRLFSLRFGDSELDKQLLPHTLSGEEHVSACYKLELTCLSSNAALELKSLLAQAVDVVIHMNDGSERVISGIITGAKQFGSDGGFANYALTVEPALSTLKLRRNSRVFQGKSVVDIVKIILDEHIANNPVFAQCFRHRDQLKLTYAARNYCQQYRESDFDFLTRLLREEGISYYFDFEHGAAAVGLHTLVLFDSATELNSALQSDIRFHRADHTEADDTLTDWRSHRQIQSGAVALASYDYKDVNTHNGAEKSAVDHGESGCGLAAGLEDYDPQSTALDYNNNGPAANGGGLNRSAQLRQQAHDLRAKTFFGSGVVRGLSAGQAFALSDHPAHEYDSGTDREFVVLSQQFTARNNLPGELNPFALIGKKIAQNKVENAANDEPGYWNKIAAVRKSTPIVPEYAHSEHAKPSARGMQSATVVGPAGEEIYTDELGRVKIQFHWARPQDHNTGTHGASADKNDFSSCWVRVQMPSAGAQWGHQFIPRVGQEVLVDFIEGDIDHPVITHVIHNGQQRAPTFGNTGSLPANKTLSGIKSHEYRGDRHNEIIFDDTQDEIRVTLATEHGKTQLNQGYLIHSRSEGKGAPRGEGFELRTDNAGAIRAAQGLLLTTEAQANAGGKQLDRSAALAQLEAANNLSKQFGDVANQHHANQPNLDPVLNADQLKDKKPHVLMHGHGGAALTTPQSITIAAGKDFNQISLRDTHQTSGKRWMHNVSESISLFVANAQNKIKTAIKLLAAKGDVLVQAQSNDVEITADKNIKITACKDTLTASAGKEFLLQSGGGYIKVSGGNIDIHCPGALSMKAASFVHEGGASVDYNPIKPGIAGFDNTTLLGGIANTVLNQAAVVTSKFRKDGMVVQPFTGVEVSRPDQQNAKMDNFLLAGGALSKLARPVSGAVSLERHSMKLPPFDLKRTLPADEANIGFGKPPYKAESHVGEATLLDDSKFVRLYDSNNSGQLGRWMMPESEVRGLTPTQVQEKFALPQAPTNICEVNVPAGTTFRFGEVGPISGWGKGGGTQIQLMDRIPASSYVNSRPFP